MSIQKYREILRDIPGIERLTMQYEEGGKIEVFSIGTKVVRLKAPATIEQIRAAFTADA